MNHDAHEKIFPADPLITAYAFGELEGDELARIETAVQADPELQATVAELRAFGGQLTTTLVSEKTDAEPGAHESADAVAKPKRRGLRIPFPLYYVATTAAACFAVVVWLQSEAPAPRPQPMQAKRPAAPGVIAKSPSALVENAVMAPVVTPVPPVALASVDAAKVERPAAVARTEPFAGKRELLLSPLLGDMSNDGSASAPAPTLSLVKKQETTLFNSGSPEVSLSATISVSGFAQPAAPLPASAGQLLARGRSQYLAGESGQAEGSFQQVLATDPQNREAKYFVGRIEKDKSKLAELDRAKARAQMVEEVTSAWQRPAEYVNVSSDQSGLRAAAPRNSESYTARSDNAYLTVADAPLSTFSIDVDTASYANIRRFLTGGHLPPRDAVRIEELINYFPYAYAAPAHPPLPPGARAKYGPLPPFAAHLAIASAPWAPAHRLVRIGLKGREFTADTRPAANLVFLLDVSGSMHAANRLPLVKESLRMLVEHLRADDHVAIVTYASGSGLALPSTPASQKSEILEVLDNLHAGGSTNGAMGIQLAYDVAKANFVTGGINRVILCTDGDFNVGITDRGELVRLIEEKAKSRVFLSVFGFGMGNYKDSTLVALADKGNGAYGYIDTRREAEKVFVEQAEGTLATIAKDVKIQVEFNPARVAAYRLIGYEKRMLAKEDFNNDAVDAGEVGAGHTVTALYEIVPVGLNDDGAARPTVDALKYQQAENRSQKLASADSPELLTVKIRYKDTEGDVSKKLEFPLIDTGADFAKADGEFRFAAAVAAWGMLLRDSPHKGSATFDQVAGWAEDGLGNDEGGYRAEFIQLVRRSAELRGR